MDRKEKLLVACTLAIVITLAVCTAIVQREIKNLPSPPDFTAELQRIEELDESIDTHLACVNYRLMNAGEKLTYLQLHPADTC
jgi:hypothetical protein